MKENIDILRVYNLVDSNGTKLQLRLGRHKYSEDYLPDKGFRWSFAGPKIPMPVRSETWFNGFPENIMLDWLKGNGWAIRSRVEMGTGKATVYELPFHDEPSKGNEKTTEVYPVPEGQLKQGECDFKAAIRNLYSNGGKLRAVSLYRYVHPCSLSEACRAINDICGLDTTL